MNPNPFLGVLYHWTGGLSAASCYLPFRGIRRWSWEIYWLVQGCFSWIVAPPIVAALLVPGFVGILRAADRGTVAYAIFWGAMWGVGGLLFGLGVRYLGIALGYTIALGFSTQAGGRAGEELRTVDDQQAFERFHACPFRDETQVSLILSTTDFAAPPLTRYWWTRVEAWS